MAFDLEIWKEKVQERLHGWRPRMQAAGAHSVYGFLSASLVEAAQRGCLIPVGMAVGSLYGGGDERTTTQTIR